MTTALTLVALFGIATPALAADVGVAESIAPSIEMATLTTPDQKPEANRSTRSSTSRSRSTSSRPAARSTSRPSAHPSSRAPVARPSSRAPVARPATRAPVARPNAVRGRAPAHRPPTYRTSTARPGPRTAVRPAPRTYGTARSYRSVRTRGVSVGVRRTLPPPPIYRGGVVVRRAAPWHGVFVYGPRPVYHRQYVDNRQVEVREEHLPERKVDRQGSVALGVRSGSYLSGYEGGSSYGDFGLGLVGRWRPDEAVGIELSVAHHNETFNMATERSQTLVQGSAMLFARPWSRMQPYVLGGLSVNERGLDDAFFDGRGNAAVVNTKDTLIGPHAGVGIEFAFGQKAALDLEARYVGWLNETTAASPGALTTSATFMVHF